jgi:hypothetical protein
MIASMFHGAAAKHASGLYADLESAPNWTMLVALAFREWAGLICGRGNVWPIPGMCRPS